PDWRSYKQSFIQVNADSRGTFSVRTGRALLSFGMEGQDRSDFWRAARAVVLPDNSGFEIVGTNRAGVAITMKVTVTNDTLSCVYRADAPLSLTGKFPGEPEANWFRSLSADGKEVQGEIWGEYRDLRLYEFIEYTYLERRMRIAFGMGMPMALQPCFDPLPQSHRIAPASFTLALAKEGNAYTANFTVQSLAPENAPLADPKSTMVTGPFDRDKMQVNPPKTWVPDVEFLAKNGGPAIFKRAEKPAFRMTLTDDAQKRLSDQPIEIRCVNSLDDVAVERVPLRPPKRKTLVVTLKPVKQGPYRIELWSGDTKVGANEFAVVGPIEQRKVGPLDKDTLRLREVDRIECAEDNGRHEFYCISPDRIVTGRTAQAGAYIEDNAILPKGPSDHEWMAYRVNGLATDKPHLLEVEYPDIDDMAVGISVMHPCLPPDIPRDTDGKRIITPKAAYDFAVAGGKDPKRGFVPSATPGFISGLGYPLSGKKQSVKAVFFPGDDWAVIQFDNYNYLTRKPMRVCRIVVSEILDDLPMADAPHLGNERLFGRVDEGLNIPMNTLCAMALVRGELTSDGVATRPGTDYKWNYVAAERLVKYLRFRGENAWFPIVFRYGVSTWYPSRIGFSGRLDIPALYARLFEENGLKMVPTVSFMPSFPLRLQDRYTAHDIAQGADAYLQVSALGGGQASFLLPMRAPNPLHPLVQAEMTGFASELARRYKDYPAVKGIMFVSSLNIAFGMPSFDGGGVLIKPPPNYDYDATCFRATYDDHTIGLFEKYAGVKVPVGDTRDPGRFAARKAWLLSHHKDAWAAFRCQAIADVWSQLAASVKQACPRMTLFGNESWYGNATVAYASDTNRPAAMNHLRRMGSAIAAPQRPKDCVLSCYFNPMNGNDEAIFWSYVAESNMPRYNAMNLDKSTTPVLEENDSVGAYLGRAFFEMLSRPTPPERPWYTSRAHTCRYPLPGNRGSMLDYAVILSRCTPLYLDHCWTDGGIPLGHDDDYREFASAYRAIPSGKYRTVFHEEYPGITVRSATVARKTSFYAVNTDSKPRTVAVQAAGRLAERTAGYPALSVTGGMCRVELPPYALRVFEIAKGKLAGVRVE
ncbi:MAG: hypothetical protein PHR35_05415, partial [Kiritimatiellae bacterium]|nr:hypothetical protein [Kiritimatiellia bacterium]